MPIRKSRIWRMADQPLNRYYDVTRLRKVGKEERDCKRFITFIY